MKKLSKAVSIRFDTIEGFACGCSSCGTCSSCALACPEAEHNRAANLDARVRETYGPATIYSSLIR